MRYIIVDLEATCWNNTNDRTRMEIIEIGAVELATSSGPIETEFSQFVRPVVEPILSDFCRTLTSIRQTDVDGAETFPVVFTQFLDWIGERPFALCSWGDYDLRQFRLDCTRHNLPLPSTFERHINLKREYAGIRLVKSCGMGQALKREKIPLVGTHHRGIDDARNIAQVALRILPLIEARTSHDDLH